MALSQDFTSNIIAVTTPPLRNAHVHCRNTLLWNTHISKCGIWSLFANLVTDFNQMSPTRIRRERGLKNSHPAVTGWWNDEWRLSEQHDVRAKCRDWWTYIASMFKITTCYMFDVWAPRTHLSRQIAVYLHNKMAVLSRNYHRAMQCYAVFSHDANRNGFWSLSVFLECASWTNLRVVHNTMSLSVAL